MYIYIYIQREIYIIYIERYVNTCADTYLVQMYGSYVKCEKETIIKKVILKSYYQKVIVEKLLPKGF